MLQTEFAMPWMTLISHESRYKFTTRLQGRPDVENEEIRLTGVVVEEVGEPRNDGTPGSALYAVPFGLSQSPSPLWVQCFLRSWDLPKQFTSMHRPGIARVRGDRLILDGTTIEEVEKYHLQTLKLAIAEANELVREEQAGARQRINVQDQKKEAHRKHVEAVAKRLKFEN